MFILFQKRTSVSLPLCWPALTEPPGRRGLAGLLCSVLVLASCGGRATGDPAPSGPSVTGVDVACTPSSIRTGQTSTCTATVTGSGSFSHGVTWSTTCGTVDDAGVLSLPTACAAVVRATSVQDASRSGAATVTASSPPATGRALAEPYANIQLIGNTIFDTAGEPVVGRGPEFVSASTDDVNAIDTMAGWGSNAIRILITLDAANGMTPAGFDAILGRAASHGMLIWVSLYTWDDAHGHAISAALGGGNFYSLTAPPGTGTCSRTTPGPCYLAVWSRPWLEDLMAKYAAHVIIDAMQEYIGVAEPSTEAGRIEWAAAAKDHVAFFRRAGYTQPLEVMSNFQGRDLYAIHEYGHEIRAVDTVNVGGYPQTMFGWQAYWGVGWYPGYQGELFLGQGQSLGAAQAIHQFATQEDFPIEMGFDNYPGDANLDYVDMIDQAAADGGTWLWWSYGDGDVDCPASGATCQAYVKAAPNGFGGAVPISTTSARPWTLPANRVRVWPRAGHESGMVGGTIRGSNTSATANLVTLATISSAPTSAGLTVTFTNASPYRYLVYVGPDGSFGDLAEIEFYSGNIRLTGTALGSDGHASAFDRDLTTAFHGPAADGAYVGLDLGAGP